MKVLVITHNRFKRILIVTTIILMLALTLNDALTSPSKAYKLGPDVQELLNYVNSAMPSVSEHVKYFASLGSRVPGYSGNEKAAEYIYNKLIEYRLDEVFFEEFNVTVPIDYGASIEVITESGVEVFNAYTVLPNLVETCTTPPEGIEGRLIYVASIEEITGKDINGSIVMMRFDGTGYSWMRLVSIGARGIIFIIDDKSDDTTTLEAVDKYASIPIDIPRVAVDVETALKILNLLKHGEVKVRLKVKMEYEVVTTKNVIGIKRARTGSKYANEAIMLVAYYDSWSVTPAWAPGADEAISVAILLEIARYIATIETERNVVFIAFSGHHQGIAGAREYVYWHIRPRTEDAKKMPEWMFLEGSHVPLIFQIDASAYYSPLGRTIKGETIGAETEIMVFDAGSFYGGTGQDHRLKEQGYVNPKGDFGEYVRLDGGYYGIDDVIAFLFYEYNISFGNMVHERKLTNMPFYDPGSYTLARRRYYEIEPFLRVGQYAFVISCGTYSPLRFTPADNWYFTKDRVKNTWPYFLLVLTWLKRFVTYESDIPNYTPKTINDNSYPTLIVYVEEFLEELQKYAIVPNAIVIVHFNPRSGSVNHVIVSRTNEKGFTIIRGVAYSGISGYYYIYAYKDDPSEGPIDYAPDMGETAKPSYAVIVSNATYIVTASTFKASSMVLFDVIDPETMKPLLPDILIINHYTKNGAKYFGLCFDYSWNTISPQTIRANVMLYVSYDPRVEPGPPWDIVMYPELSRNHLIILTNEGKGYWLKKGEQRLMYFSPLIYAKEMIEVSYENLEKARRYKIFTGPIDRYYELATQYLEEAYEALKNKDYRKTLALGVVSWSYARITYLDLRGILMDTSVSAIFFLLLAIPFAYLVESLLFEFESLRKKVAAMAVTIIVAACAMYLIHPALAISPNAPLVALSFVLIILSATPMAMIISKVIEITKRVRKELIGLHFSEISRTGAVILAASMATRNLRRRRLRALLTMISTIIIVAAFVSTVSVTVTRTISILEMYDLEKAPYDGILVSMGELDVLPIEVIEGLKGEFSGEIKYIAPRAYFEPSIITMLLGLPVRAERGYLKVTVVKTGKTFYIKGLLGLSAVEKYISDIDKATGGVFFASDNVLQCILPSTFKEMYNISEGDYISFEGDNFMVIGFFDINVFKTIVDLNRETLAPYTVERAGEGRAPTGEAVRVDPTELIIVPYKVVLKHHGAVFNVAITFKDPEKVYEVAMRLTERSRLKVYACKDNKVKVFTRVMKEQLIGSEVLLPSIIIVLIIMNTGLGAIYERRREVDILSAVGLSPIHVAGLFLAEFIIIGVISGFIGYLVGVSTPYFIPELKANTASSYVAIAVGISIIVILAAVLYPVWLASRSVTPSFERKWKLERAGVRRGDVYTINIPVVVSPLELDGLVYYLMEYLELFKLETEAKRFMVEEMKMEERRTPDGELKLLRTRVRVRPFDYGVVMDADVSFLVPYSSQVVRTIVNIKRLGGMEHVWLRGVRAFADEVRKQLLLWRSLSLNERREYMRKAKEYFKKLRS